MLVSPEAGAGKSTVMTILELLTPNPIRMVIPTVAVIYRSVNKASCTVLLDETDTLFERGNTNSDLNALLNEGYRKGAKVRRMGGKNNERVDEFSVFSPVALGGVFPEITVIPATILTRSVVIPMHPKRPDESVEEIPDGGTPREALEERLGNLNDSLGEWAEDNKDVLSTVQPDIPDSVTNRRREIWRPLLKVAEIANGPWPSRARKVCSALETRAVDARGTSLGVRLLTDLYEQVFAMKVRKGQAKVMRHDPSVNQLHTDTILERLFAIDDAPWAMLGGKGLDGRGLANLLKRYGVHSKSVRVGDRSAKGYSAADLYDKWSRYVPSARVATVGSQGSQRSRGSQRLWKRAR